MSETMTIPEFITSNKEDIMTTLDNSNDKNDDKIEKIVVIGIGGAGNNAVQYLYEQEDYLDTVGKSVSHYVLNTDENCLRSMSCKSQIVLGPKKCKGKGAGANINVGREATLESIADIKEICKGADLIFLTAGMGGGTGTLGASVVAEAAHEAGTIVVSLVTLPYRYENRAKSALAGVRELFKFSDSLILIDNQKIVDFYPDCEFCAGLDKANEILANAISGVIKIIHNPSKINTDFEDLKTILHSGGKSQILYNSLEGEELDNLSTEPDKAINEIYTKVTNSPLITKSDIKEASSFLMLFECTHHFTQKIIDKLVQKFSNPDNIQSNNNLDDLLEDMDKLISSDYDDFEDDNLPKVIFAYNKINADENDSPKIIVTIVATGMDTNAKKKANEKANEKNNQALKSPVEPVKPSVNVQETESTVQNNQKSFAENKPSSNEDDEIVLLLNELEALNKSNQLPADMKPLYLKLKTQYTLSQLKKQNVNSENTNSVAGNNVAGNNVDSTTTKTFEPTEKTEQEKQYSTTIPNVPNIPNFVNNQNIKNTFTTVEKSPNTPVQSDDTLYSKEPKEVKTESTTTRKIPQTFAPLDSDIGIDE